MPDQVPAHQRKSSWRMGRATSSVTRSSTSDVATSCCPSRTSARSRRADQAARRHPPAVAQRRLAVQHRTQRAFQQRGVRRARRQHQLCLVRKGIAGHLFDEDDRSWARLPKLPRRPGRRASPHRRPEFGHERAWSRRVCVRSAARRYGEPAVGDPGPQRDQVQRPTPRPTRVSTGVRGTTPHACRQSSARRASSRSDSDAAASRASSVVGSGSAAVDLLVGRQRQRRT